MFNYLVFDVYNASPEKLLVILKHFINKVKHADKFGCEIFWAQELKLCEYKHFQIFIW